MQAELVSANALAFAFVIALGRLTVNALIAFGIGWEDFS